MKLLNQTWAFIPARSGSKSIKNKNLLKLNGIHLIGHSILFAKKLKKISKVVFSSDSKKYLKIAKKYNCDEAILRNKSLAKDNTEDIEVFYDYVMQLIIKKKELPKYFLHLRPTTPIRTVSNFNKAYKLFLKNEKRCSSLRSVFELSETSYKSMRIINNKLCSLLKRDFDMDKLNKPRQNFPTTYVANGELDLIKTENILKKKLHGKKVLPFITSEFNSDIDDMNDFKKVSFYLNKNYK